MRGVDRDRTATFSRAPVERELRNDELLRNVAVARTLARDTFASTQRETDLAHDLMIAIVRRATIMLILLYRGQCPAIASRAGGPVCDVLGEHGVDFFWSKQHHGLGVRRSHP